MHPLYDQYKKAVDILKARGLKVEGPDGLISTDPTPADLERGKNEPAIFVTRKDWPIETWFFVEAPTAKRKYGKTCIHHPGNDEFKDSVVKEGRFEASTAEELVAVYDGLVKWYVDDHNKDHDSFVTELIDMGDEPAQAERAAKPFTGGRLSYEPKGKPPAPHLTPKPVSPELAAEREKNDRRRKNHDKLIKDILSGKCKDDDPRLTDREYQY